MAKFVPLHHCFHGSSADKESTCNAGDPCLIPGSGRSPGEGIGYPLQYSWGSLVVQMVKNLPAMLGTWVNPWVEKTPWRRAWPPTPVFLPGESPWMEKPSGLKSLGSQRIGHDWATKHSKAQRVPESFQLVLVATQGGTCSSRSLLKGFWQQVLE